MLPKSAIRVGVSTALAVLVLPCLFFTAARAAATTFAGCVQSGTKIFHNNAFPTQGSQFNASFAATPNQANMYGLVGFSLNAATVDDSLAAFVRFSNSGVIDVRNGNGFSANVVFPYKAGQQYQFQLIINPATKRYSVFVTAPGGSPVQLASNYAFRTSLWNVSSLNNWATYTESGTESVCNMTIGASGSAGSIAPTITTQPLSQTIIAGQTATFSVAATGTTPLIYQWRKNGTAITGATSPNYTTPAETTSDNGAQFTVVVSNSAGSVTSSGATLTVSAATIAPTITTQPLSQTIIAGQTATFSVAATGTTPLIYQWRKNGTAITGATSPNYTTPAETTSDNGAQFTVVVSNSAGSVTSSAATLTVNAATVSPTITTQPLSQTIIAGQTATFSVAATGTTPLIYQWRKNGTAITGATSPNYTTPAETTSDNGAQFTVVVSNSAGSVTSSGATLTVNAATIAPTITTQPLSQTIIAGQTATFSITATGTAPLNYQWRKNGTAISGATSSSYTTPAETTSDNGAQFTVVVSNSAGSVTSSAATLAVTAPGTLSLSSSTLTFNSVTVGTSSNLPATLTNTGSSSVTISGVVISGPGFIASGISVGQIIPVGQTATLNVTFAPASTGSVTGAVSITSNASNSSIMISLSGTGAAAVSHSVTLTWTASTSTVIGYNVYRSAVSGGSYTKLTASADSATSYSDTSVQAGQTYYYVVTAVNSSLLESVFSNQVSATIP